MKTQAISHSQEETRNIGQRLAYVLQAGDVVLLTGPMGAGKSELARGIIRGLGAEGPVISPTFTILNLYSECDPPVHHFDWYRVDGMEELMESGLDEFIGGEALTLIEWHERAPDLLPADCLEIGIHPTEHEGTRRIQWSARGNFRGITIA